MFGKSKCASTFVRLLSCSDFKGPPRNSSPGFPNKLNPPLFQYQLKCYLRESPPSRMKICQCKLHAKWRLDGERGAIRLIWTTPAVSNRFGWADHLLCKKYFEAH
ncbi:hypothetical protein AVEN_243857-1 [Araneus ventricosus]|uniref:Uncharacterized protein n=1 Tax=Araneus ventricosus TaxID=182803 RepID=A0A4Y2A5L2_ARAVE|nr:hypothetical protein AVEN_243857-1 [Araneus ventricosus]